MAARAGLSSSQAFEGAHSMDLPHSPSSQQASPVHQRTETGLEGVVDERQEKGTLLEWLRVEMRKEFKGLVQEHQAAGSHSKDKSLRRRSSTSPPLTPKRAKEDLAFRPTVSEYPSDSDPDSSAEGEEGEISEEEGEAAVVIQQNRLFPADLYHRMLPKVLRALDIPHKSSGDTAQDPEYPRGSGRSLPRCTSEQKGMPLPDIFHDTLRAEWEHPAKPKSTHPYFFQALFPYIWG